MDDGSDETVNRALQRTIRQISEKIEGFRFNTMVSTLMAFVNLLTETGRQGQWKTVDFQAALETLMVIMAPAAPHICEELWQITGHAYSVHQESWPTWDAELARSEIDEVAVQVDGKLRGVVQVSEGMEIDEVEALARRVPKAAGALLGRTILKVVYVPGRLINFVSGINKVKEEGER